ncbi:hypothetical protein L0152_22410 [bacterium]|nr:hypothetical protein [bacterium]
MRSKTETVIVNQSKDAVFSYLASVDNLPEWATEFCRKLENRNGNYYVHSCDSSAGELFFKIESDARTGVVDMFAGPNADQLGIFPIRIVGLPDGNTAVIFTMFQPPDLTDEKFEAQYQSLLRELSNLRRHFQSNQP